MTLGRLFTYLPLQKEQKWLNLYTLANHQGAYVKINCLYLIPKENMNAPLFGTAANLKTAKKRKAIHMFNLYSCTIVIEWGSKSSYFSQALSARKQLK